MRGESPFDALKVTETPRGAEIDLLVSPGSSRDRLLGVHDGALKIAVTAPPERGRANRAAVTLLSRALDLRQKDVQIIAGSTSRRKKVLFPGLRPGELRERLESIR